MRLVWTEISLILIVSMIGIVGVQESFADDVMLPEFVSKMEFSNIPKLGEIVQITITSNILPNIPEESITSIWVTIPSGFELVSAEDFTFYRDNSKYGIAGKIFEKNISLSDFDDNFTLTSIITVKAIQTGNWVIESYPKKLIIVIEENESHLLSSIHDLPPQPVIPEPPPKPVTIHLSPKKQMATGTISFDIICREGLQLIFKATNGHPFCVKPSTAEKLTERGWVKDIQVIHTRLLSPEECKEQSGKYNHCPPCSEGVQCEPCTEYCRIE